MTLSAIENAQNKAQDMQQSPYLNFDTAIAYLSEKWQLSNLQVFVYPSIFNNYIARAYSDTYQQEVVLKISESNDECKALQYLQSTRRKKSWPKFFQHKSSIIHKFRVYSSKTSFQKETCYTNPCITKLQKLGKIL